MQDGASPDRTVIKWNDPRLLLRPHPNIFENILAVSACEPVNIGGVFFHAIELRSAVPMYTPWKSLTTDWIIVWTCFSRLGLLNNSLFHIVRQFIKTFLGFKLCWRGLQVSAQDQGRSTYRVTQEVEKTLETWSLIRNTQTKRLADKA